MRDLAVKAELISSLDDKYLSNVIVFEVMTASAALMLKSGDALRDDRGDLDQARIRERIEKYSWSIPAFRQRLVSSPLGVTASVWVPVEAIDMDYHVQFHPGVVSMDASGVEILTGRTSGPLLADRPLWRFLVVQLDTGRVAFVVTWHHVVGDAMYGIKMGDILFQAEPLDSMPVVDEADRRALGRAPRTRLGALLHVFRDWLSDRTSSRDAWREYWRKPFRRRLRRWGGRVIRPIRNWHIERAGLRSRLPERHSRMVEFDLSTSAQQARRLGGSLNDLTVGATLKAIIEVSPGLEEAALLVPISRRRKGENDVRNDISVVRVSVPASMSLPEMVDSVRAQTRSAFRTGESAITKPGDWSGYATSVQWGQGTKYFGAAEMISVAGWPAGDPNDDVAVLSCAFSDTLTFSLTTRRTTDIDALVASITASMTAPAEVAQ